jgi:hypothetical protein
MNDEISYSKETESICSTNPNKFHLNHNIHDKGFNQVIRSKKPRGKFLLGYYNTTMYPETRIRNAVTGYRYRDDHPKLKYLVGSRQEDLFFKTCIANGETGNNPVFLFYDNPEQFEKHQKILLSQVIKEKWYKKNMECRLQNLKYRNDNE